MKRLPIGTSDFEEIIKEGYYYVDKTLLIEDIVTLSGKVKLITRPRRFGKTLNMNMLQRFFSMEEEEDLFSGLKIMEKKEIVKKYYHKYPTVFVSFKDVNDTTWQGAYSTIKGDLSRVAMKYMKLDIPDFLKKRIELIASMEADVGIYKDTLRVLSEVLHEVTGKKVILLIDEYDVPIENAYLNDKDSPGYYKNMISFMRGLLSASLKDNPHLEFAVLTGVYRIAKESIFSGLNNLKIFSVFDEKISDKFGFTEDEVIKMIGYYKLGEKDKEIIDSWYGNYRIGDQDNLYNPWSVINYIDNRLNSELPAEAHAQKYWTNTSSNELIKNLVITSPEVHENIYELINGEEIKKELDPSISLVELEDDPKNVWVLFASTGYLSAKYIPSGIGNLVYSLKIPNEEIMRFFKKTVIEWIEKKGKIRLSKMVDGIRELLLYGKHERFTEGLEEFLMNGISFYDVGKDEGERFYKGLLLGLLSVAVNGYVVESETESGYGRLDIAIYPKEKEIGGYAAIFEVKKAKDEEKLEELAKEAFMQIKEKRYYAKMKSLGYRVIGFGIAFCRKKVKTEVGEI